MAMSQRQNDIVRMLQNHGECSVEFLSEQLKVSGMTVRRDLQQLEDERKVIRTHGGALPGPRVSFEFQFLTRMEENKPAKEAIAAAAARYVQNEQTILLDSGTTTLLLAQQMAAANKNLRVITTSLPIAAALQYSTEIEVLVLGGVLRRNAPDLVGPLTETNLENLRADLVLVGADAVDETGNVFNNSMTVGRMLSKMVTCSKQVYVLADSTKLNRTAMMRFGCAKDWTGLITDAQADPAVIRLLRRAGVNVLVADIPQNSETLKESGK